MPPASSPQPDDNPLVTAFVFNPDACEPPEEIQAATLRVVDDVAPPYRPPPVAESLFDHGSHVALEARAIANAERVLAATFEHGPIGVLDIDPESFPTKELVDVAKLIQKEEGRRGWHEFAGLVCEQGLDEADSATLRIAIATIAQRPVERPEALEGAARIVQEFNVARWRQRLAWRLKSALESGGDVTPILREIEALERVQQAGGIDRYRVDHASTVDLGWAEIEALRPPFIIDGFVRRGEVLLLGAESKSRKSWLAQDAGFCVAAGIPWLADDDGVNGFATARAKVIVLDLELSPSEMLFRFAKARGNRFEGDLVRQREITDSVAAYSFDGMNVADILPLIEKIAVTVAPGDLVVIDCLYRLVPDGNETADVAAMFEVVKRFASETQAGVILVDHFRKAGDEKARNRFAGTFVKQASASTLVAIEVTADDVLSMSIDARTFHGCPRVYARFDLDSYAFRRIPDLEIQVAKDSKAKAEEEGWIVSLWRSKAFDFQMTAVDAGKRWGVTRQSSAPRLRKLVAREWLTESDPIPGKATTWALTPSGKAVVSSAIGLTH